MPRLSPGGGRRFSDVLLSFSRSIPASFPRSIVLSIVLSILLAVSLAGFACSGSGAEPGGGEAAASQPASGDAALGSAELGEGFVVWESNRGGPWRLWRRQLDGSGLRQITPHEEGRDHCCPHVAPDGRTLAYLSLVPGQRGKGQPIRRGELRLVSLASGEMRVLDADARVPSEQRAVVWRSPEELLWIRGDGHTVLRNLTTGEERRLTREPHPTDGWLMNRPLTYATAGWPTFSPYDAATRRIAEQPDLGGCQPYFSHDGVWGFWAAGAGGPLRRIDLATRAVGTILEKGDRRLPADRGYLYFPMLSRDGTLFAWGASPGGHDFNRADYDIFVAEVDPATLELAGEPVRLTADPATDRFPEVFRRPLLLGRHRGEAPLPVRFRLPREGSGQIGWRVDFGDGGEPATAAAGEALEHTYAEPGIFEVRAVPGSGGDAEMLRGRVRVEPPRPPRPVGVEIRGGTTLVVGFDEPVRAAGAEASLGSGRRVVSVTQGDDGRTVRVELAASVEGPDQLRLAGVTDCAAAPNRMEPATLAVEPPTWPSRREGLAFLWQHGNAPNLIDDAGGGAARTFALTSRGPARLDHFWTLRPAGGFFIAQQDAWEHVTSAVRRTNRMSVELTVRPGGGGGGSGDGGVELLRLGPEKNPYLVLTLEEGRLGLALRLGEVHRRRLFEVSRDGPTHVVVTWEPGRLRAYRDGEPSFATEEIRGDFFAWKRPGPLVFGAPLAAAGDDPVPWDGRLEGVAVYDRVLGPEEVAENHRRYGALLERRTPPPRLTVEAALAARSEVPTLEQIAPYREGLVVFEYRLGRVLSGEAPEGETIRVAHWALLDGEPRPAARRREGETVKLTLEPFAANPQLEGLFVSDTLPPRGGPLWFDVAP